jgi:hypothetical protein
MKLLFWCIFIVLEPINGGATGQRHAPNVPKLSSRSDLGAALGRDGSISIGAPNNARNSSIMIIARESTHTNAFQKTPAYFGVP